MNPMPSVMKHSFSNVPRANIQRSSFNRSHGRKTTFDAGYIVPVFVDEALPGDTMNVRMSAFLRLATPLHPYMDNAYCESFFFAVPMRLLWRNWERFNGAQDNPGDSTDFVTPKFSASAALANSSLHDYFGFPTGVPITGNKVVSYFHRAYYKIWNDWFRDQNLQDSLVWSDGDGPDTFASFELQKRGKRHDYFTSGLPWPQKGPSVDLPLGERAPIVGLGTGSTSGWAAGPFNSYETGGSGASVYASYKTLDAGSSGVMEQDPDNPGYPGVWADLSAATAATINSLRQAFAVQGLFERDARGGTRYIEIILSHFNVVSPDARMQRSEFLGGGRSRVNVTPVIQNSESTTESPQGNLAGVGVVAMSSHGFTKSFTEHCVVLGFVVVRADLTYQQGLNKMFTRSTRFDFYWPALAHLGEQPIYNYEIFYQGTDADDEVFAYQEKDAEYRYKPSEITGQFRSNFAQSLDTWHLSQEFGSLPLLNEEFIEEDPPFDRVIAVTSEPHFIGDFYFNFQHARPIPIYAVPGLISRF